MDLVREWTVDPSLLSKTRIEFQFRGTNHKKVSSDRRADG